MNYSQAASANFVPEHEEEKDLAKSGALNRGRRKKVSREEGE